MIAYIMIVLLVNNIIDLRRHLQARNPRCDIH